jgi:hypothetical protein
MGTDGRDEVYIRTWAGGSESESSDAECDSLHNYDSDENDAASLPDSTGSDVTDTEGSIPSDVATYLAALDMGSLPNSSLTGQSPLDVDDPLDADDIDMEKAEFGSMYCPGILLWGRNCEFSDMTDDNNAINERIGVGELREDLLCDLKDLEAAQWTDVYIQ